MKQENRGNFGSQGFTEELTFMLGLKVRVDRQERGLKGTLGRGNRKSREL